MFPTSSRITTTSTEDTGNVFVFDYNTGQHEMKNGVLVECDETGNVKQYIQNVLRTQAGSYKVYTVEESENFGVSVYKYIGSRQLPMGYLNSELKREVTEQLLKHRLVESVTEWKGERKRRGLDISFKVTLTDGSILEEQAYVSSDII